MKITSRVLTCGAKLMLGRVVGWRVRDSYSYSYSYSTGELVISSVGCTVGFEVLGLSVGDHVTGDMVDEEFVEGCLVVGLLEEGCIVLL